MNGKAPDRGLDSAARLCERLHQSWDSMFFETVDPTRLGRVDGILQVLGSHLDGPVSILELGCGPGTMTARLLDRFPRSRVVAVDTDPVLLRVGAQALRRYRKRVAWVLADLREKGWSLELPVRRFDAAISSLTLHWLEENEVRALYRDLRPLLRRGGLLVNGDYLPSNGLRAPRKPAGPPRRRPRRSDGVRAFQAAWGKWWGALVNEPSMRDVLEERRARMPGEIPPRRTTGPAIPASLEAHKWALRAAGFHESTVSWQDRGFCVLVGTR